MVDSNSIPAICEKECPAVCSIFDRLFALKTDMLELERSRLDVQDGDTAVIADILSIEEQIKTLESTLQQLGQTCIRPQHLIVFLGNSEQQEVTACTSPQAYDDEHPVLNVVSD